MVVEVGFEPTNGNAEWIYSPRPLATWIFHRRVERYKTTTFALYAKQKDGKIATITYLISLLNTGLLAAFGYPLDDRVIIVHFAPHHT